jgi:hypothetical protein
MSLEWARARARENEARLRVPLENEGRAQVVQHPIGPLRVVLAGIAGAPADTRERSCAERLGLTPLARVAPDKGAQRAVELATGT